MSEPKSFAVKLKVEVTKECICEGCTQEEAESDPWKYAIDEVETGMSDWEVLSIRENT